MVYMRFFLIASLLFVALPASASKDMSVPDLIKQGKYRELASLDPNVFRQSNSGSKLTRISELLSSRDRWAIITFDLLVRAAAYDKGNIATKTMIVDEIANSQLYFNDTMKKIAAKKIKLRLGKVQEQELRERLSRIAQNLDPS